MGAGIGIIRPGGAAGSGSWDVTGAAFVDPVNGNNGTAVVGDGNKPYATVAAALVASNFVILKPGTYTELISITANNKHISCMDGVTFTAGGVSVTGGTVTSFKFSGDAVFNGLGAQILRIIDSNAVIEYEFKNAPDCSRICFVEGSTAFAPKVKMTADYVRCNSFNGAAYASRIQGGAQFEFNFKFYAEAQHDLYHARNTTAGAKWVINCPENRIIDNYTSNYGNINRRVVRITDFVTNLDMVINGDCVSTYSSTVNDQGVVHFESLTNVAAFPIFTLNGNIISDNMAGIVSRLNSRYGEFNFNGDVICKSAVSGWSSYPFQLQLAGTAGAYSQTFRFNGGYIQGATRCIIGRGKYVYMKDCTYYNSDAGGTESAFFMEQTGTANQELYLYNTIVETDAGGVTPELVKGNAAGALVYTAESKGNVVFGATYVDGWAQYAQIVGLVVPKF
jgi:hypothetical protein